MQLELGGMSIRHIIKTSDKFRELNAFPDVVWTIKDVIVVLSCIFLAIVLFCLSIFSLFGANETTFNFASYVFLILLIVVPMFWIKKRYGLNKEVLGLKKNNLSSLKIGVIGGVIAILYHLLMRVAIIEHLVTPPVIKISYIKFILAPISINGFPTIILAPVAEEIMFRGFIYGYLRKKLGIILGIIMQAVCFAILHLSFSFSQANAFIILLNTLSIGLIGGMLYEKTGTLYPAIICHVFINYFAFINNVTLS